MRSAICITALLMLGGCDSGKDSSGYSLGTFRIRVSEQGIGVERADGTVLLQGTGLSPDAGHPLPGPVAWREAQPDILSAFGMFSFKEQAPAWSLASDVAVIDASETRLEMQAGDASVTYEVVQEGVLRVSWRVKGPGFNRTLQTFQCSEDDHFFGLGALVHGTEHRGESIPCWVSEQGIGKLRREGPMDNFPLMGDIHDSYMPVPFVLSSRGVGLLVEDSRRSIFHLCPTDAPDRWGVEIWNNQLQYLIIDGPLLGTVIERLTDLTGRPKPLPKWTMAPWIDAMHGQQKVLDLATRLRQDKIPAAAIWTEDWIGGGQKLGGYHLNYQWHADTSLYPDLEQLSSQLHAMGFRFLGYFNSFIEEGSRQWLEAQEQGYAVHDAAGEPIVFAGPLMTYMTLPDLTRADVADWIKGYLRQAVTLGFDGWMADYGEWLPLEASLSDGRNGLEAHNDYPLHWQRINRELWDSVRPDGDYVFFVRSGWAGTGGVAPMTWAGDQQTQFGGLDGMASVIPLMVNAGMSGIPIMTHDIAGYSTTGEDVQPTTRELFFRWTELGAFSPVMRTHHGALADQNWHWDQDAQTVEHFRRYATEHVTLFPYRYSLIQEAADSGLPVVRHMVLHHATDPGAVRIKDQFMLGPYLLVAPVQQEGATSREVYLPDTARRWHHYFTGQRLEGGKKHAVTAALDQIPVFAPAGAIIPTSVDTVDTLDRVDDASIADLDTAEQGPLGLRVYLGADGAFTMYDGTLLSLEHHDLPSSAITVLVNGEAWPACAEGSQESCVRQEGERALTVLVGPVTSLSVAGQAEGKALFVLDVSSAPRARGYRVVLSW